MRTAAFLAWSAILLSAAWGPTRLTADPVAGPTLRTEHYDLYCEDNLDTNELGRLLESLHAKLTRFFGEAPPERLRIEILADEPRFRAVLDDAGQAYEGGGGVYGPTFKTAWLFVQPSEFYTRQLLLHEATHQFHFLVATGNEAPSAEWYTEGLADYMGLHSWDGQQLAVGRVPLVSLEDYPAQALEQWQAADWDLAAIVAGTKKIGRGAGWMLVHFFIHRDYQTFRQLAARLDRRENPAEAFAATFGEVSAEMRRDLKRWVAERQQPFTDVWIHWQPRGDSIEGNSEVVGLCVAKETPARLEAEVKAVDGRLKAGVVFGFQGPKHFSLLQIGDDRKAHLLRRDEDRWTRVESFDTPPSDGDDKIVVEQLGDERVSLAVNGKVLHSGPAPGQVGLTVDGCRACFRVKDVRPAPCRDLSALMDAAATPSPPAPARIDPNRRDAEGRTPLHVAATDGDVAGAERLLTAGADVESTLANGVTPLMMAAFQGQRPVAELLLKAGADVNRTTPRGTTALHYAAARGDLELVNRLLAAGAKTDASKPGGTTPLILAAQNGHAGVIGALAAAGAEVNTRLRDAGITGLMLAAQNGHTSSVSALLRAGADWRLEDEQHRSALDYARANDHTKVVGIFERVRVDAQDAPAAATE